MLSAQRRRFFRHSHSYWETYDLSVYYFSLLVELDAAPCSAWCDERYKKPAASWIWPSEACFSFQRFSNVSNVVFFWPLHGHAGAIHKQDDAGSTSKDAAFRAKKNISPGWWLRAVFGSGDIYSDSELGLVGEWLWEDAWILFVWSLLWSTCEILLDGGHACVNLCAWWAQLVVCGTDAHLGAFHRKKAVKKVFKSVNIHL